MMSMGMENQIPIEEDSEILLLINKTTLYLCGFDPSN